MKTALIISSLSVLLFSACESTDDVLNKIDHIVPVVKFTSDTLDVTAGDKVTINASVEDESGIQRVEFSYGDWRINQIIDLTKEANTTSYPFTLEITVPADAAKEWEESLYFNDASSIKIIQQYHKLALSAWDRNRNLVKGYVFIRVK
jgi:hypothetical protein